MDRYSFTYEAPRWAKMSSFIKQQALFYNIDCIIEVDKGFILENGVVVLNGEIENIKILEFKITEAINNFNN